MPIAVRTQVQTKQKEKEGVSFKETEFVVQEVEFVPRSRVKGEAVVPIAEPVVAVSQGNAEDFEMVSGEDLPF